MLTYFFLAMLVMCLSQIKIKDVRAVCPECFKDSSQVPCDVKIPPVEEKSDFINRLLETGGATVTRADCEAGHTKPRVQCPVCLALFKSVEIYQKHFRAERKKEGATGSHAVNVQIPTAHMVYNYITHGYVTAWMSHVCTKHGTAVACT